MTEMRSGLPIVSFPDQASLEKWFERQPNDALGAWLKLAKKDAGVASVTRSEAVDSALCHGWIDGQLDRYDSESWLIRFTPRRARSRWSEVNRTRALDLIAAGRMRAGGLAEIDKAKADGRWQAAYASARTAEVPPDFQTALDANDAAAAFFRTLRGANRYAVLYRIGAVKRPETRARKIEEFIAKLARGEIIRS